MLKLFIQVPHATMVLKIMVKLVLIVVVHVPDVQMAHRATHPMIATVVSVMPVAFVPVRLLVRIINGS